MKSALFVDAAYVMKAFGLHRIDWTRFVQMVERDAGEPMDEKYYFSADDDPPRQANFVTFLSSIPPNGPGFRVKMYWLQKREISWPHQLGGGPVTHPSRLTPEGQPVKFLQTSQKAVDVGLAYHLIRSHSKRRWERLYLAAGDADFHEPVQALVEQDNVDLILLGTESSIASVLKPYAKRIVDLSNEPTRSAVARV